MALDLIEAPLVPQTLEGREELDISRYAGMLGGPDPTIKAEPDLPVPGDTPVKPADKAPEVLNTPEPEVKPLNENQKQGAKRLEEKEFRKRYEELEVRYKELETKAGRIPELETKETEYRTLAKQRAAELETVRNAYKNEAAIFSPDLVREVPEVRAAEEIVSRAGANLFPMDLSDQNEAEIRFDPRILDKGRRDLIDAYLDRWEVEEFSSESPANIRSGVQHVMITRLAKAIGVSDANFQELELGGALHPVIPPSHPAYQHLKRSVRDYIYARANKKQAERAALENHAESAKGLISQRVNNTKKLYQDTGVSLQGEALKEALARTPDSVNLKVVQLLQGDPDLARELQENIEREAALNGHLRPQFDFLDPDPVKRTADANIHMRRVGERALNAPLAEPLKKLVLKHSALLAERDRRIAELEAENARSVIQAEAGAITGDTGEGRQLTETEAYYENLKSRIR